MINIPIPAAQHFQIVLFMISFSRALSAAIGSLSRAV
jgi:hypothetical protein